MVAACLSDNITPIFVFDGKAPEEKKGVKEERTRIREKLKRDITDLEDQVEAKRARFGIGKSEESAEVALLLSETPVSAEEIREMGELETQLEKKLKVPSVTKESILQTKQFLTLMGAPVVQSESEGEATCALLNRFGLADAVVSDDSDVWAFGAKRVLKGLGGNSKRDDQVRLSVTPVLKGVTFSTSSFYTNRRTSLASWGSRWRSS